ncbi:hypothetical protein BDF14DRAFT_1879140 [Spinellus fusiger]|nr:hypothetical protein BDF14DRAFT_1879140 [Spinellus fusiger]
MPKTPPLLLPILKNTFMAEKSEMNEMDFQAWKAYREAHDSDWQLSQQTSDEQNNPKSVLDEYEDVNQYSQGHYTDHDEQDKSPNLDDILDELDDAHSQHQPLLFKENQEVRIFTRDKRPDLQQEYNKENGHTEEEQQNLLKNIQAAKSFLNEEGDILFQNWQTIRSHAVSITQISSQDHFQPTHQQAQSTYDGSEIQINRLSE